MVTRKLKNWAGDGANIHVFNIKPCVFLGKFRTSFCQTDRRACRLGTKALATGYFYSPHLPPGPNNSLHPGCAESHCPGVARGEVTAGIEPYIMSNITVIKVRLHCDQSGRFRILVDVIDEIGPINRSV